MRTRNWSGLTSKLFSHEMLSLARTSQKSCSHIHTIHKTVTSSTRCLRLRGRKRILPDANEELPMKKYNWILLMAFAAGLRAADAPNTNSPNSSAGSPRQSEATAGTNEPPAAKVEAGTIPDATHKPVFTTNAVAIAG